MYNNVPLPNPSRTYPYLNIEKVSKKQYLADLIKQGFSTFLDYDEIKIPERKTKYSAGYDIYTPVHISLSPFERILVPTGLKVKCEVAGTYFGIYIRSSVAIHYGLMLTNNKAIIDADYYNNPDNEGHIMIPLCNMTNEDINIPMDTRIAQGIFEPYMITDNDNSTGIRVGGYGSTGTK